MVLFAVHDLLKDPPFSHVDLISCRNLLIYLDRDLQEQVCSTFHYALNPGGYRLSRLLRNRSIIRPGCSAVPIAPLASINPRRRRATSRGCCRGSSVRSASASRSFRCRAR